MRTRSHALLLAVAGLMTGACGSSPFDGGPGAPTDRDPTDREPPDDVGTEEACRSLDEARRLGERYGELVDDVLADAEQTAADHPDRDRERIAHEALSEMVTGLDPVAVDLLDAYRAAADAGPADLAGDLEFLADYTEGVIDSWGDLLERPDVDPEAFLDTIFAGDEEQLREAVVATQRVNAFTIERCGFELSPGA